VVLPSHGAFPELLARHPGGLLVPPEVPTAIADALQTLLESRSRREELGRVGRESVLRSANASVLTDQTLAVYGARLAASKNRRI